MQHVDVSGPFSLPGTNLAVCPACGHTVSLYVCPGNKSNCNALTHGDMVSLDEGRFPTLELNNRRLSVKNSFCRKNGVYTRSVLGIPVLFGAGRSGGGRRTLSNTWRRIASHTLESNFNHLGSQNLISKCRNYGIIGLRGGVLCRNI